MDSTAISQNAVSTVIGYLLVKGYFNPASPNLPQNISILGEANTANQSGLSLTGLQITSAQQAGIVYGFGSPIHSIARILFPSNGNGVRIPVTVYAQAAADGAVASVNTITPTGTATAPGVIYLKINGREQLDGGSYAVAIATGDTPTAICGKMRTAVASVLGCPVLGTGTSTCILTAKWEGLTSNDINVVVDTANTNTGVTFAVVATTAGSGTPSTTGDGNGTTLFGNAWNTIVINSYGFVSGTLTELETFNGVPDPIAPTGRYGGTTWKPMFALTGTCADDPTSLTSGRSTQVTIVPCVAPLSLGMPYEAAANVAVLLANVLQNTPQGDVIDMSYPDMPPAAPGDIPAMTDQSIREVYVNKGCSTVDYQNGVYIVKDLVTTYDLSGEYPPFYRWVRDLNLYWEVKFGYFLLVQTKQMGKTLVNDNDVVTAANVIKPKQWKAEVGNYIDDLVSRAIIVDAAFSKSGMTVGVNSLNPNRLDTLFPVKISGLVRISATTVTGGFNFGS